MDNRRMEYLRSEFSRSAAAEHGAVSRAEVLESAAQRILS
jgi:hypothetical protein